jgi:two-component system nitrate/nitrite response regulator NarL
MIKVFITDDHKVIIDGLKRLLSVSSEIEIIGTALNGAILLDKLKTQQPDLILLDISMPVMDGIQAAKVIKKLYPTIKILVFTTFIDNDKVKKITKIGVDGYLLKDSSGDKLIHAIKMVMSGTNYYDHRVVDLVMHNYKRTASTPTITALTKREREVIRLIAQGKSSKEIGEELFISPLTVDSHRRNIFAKLGISKTAALITYAYENGLMD